jgi:hypothetical protein
MKKMDWMMLHLSSRTQITTKIRTHTRKNKDMIKLAVFFAIIY